MTGAASPLARFDALFTEHQRHVLAYDAQTAAEWGAAFAD